MEDKRDDFIVNTASFQHVVFVKNVFQHFSSKCLKQIIMLEQPQRVIMYQDSSVCSLSTVLYFLLLLWSAFKGKGNAISFKM